MGLLGDVYSYGDGLKRRLRGLLADPVGTMALGATRFGEDQQGLLNLQANAYPMMGDRTVLNSPQDTQRYRQELAGKGAEMAMGAATVWHGSPHKFAPTAKNPLGEFDFSKIGTGEGAQAYGHGGYVGGVREVGEQYRIGVKDSGKIKDINAELSRLAKVMDADSISYGKYRTDVGKQASQQYDTLMKSRSGVINDPGYLYKVDLPDEHIAKMLDWDKPLSQQAPGVQASLLDVMRKRGLPLDSNGVPLWAKSDPSGEAMHAAFGTAFAKTNSKAQVAGANLMRDAGIPGIRYLDGGSRGAGAGSSNYVVFPGNEGLLSILERNGVGR